MFTKLFFAALFPMAALFAAIGAGEKSAADCCSKQLACCQPASACCAAEKSLGCCEKGDRKSVG